MTTPFTGLYTSTTRADIIRDSLHILFCDFNPDVDNPEHQAELTSYLNELRLLMMEALNEEEVWIVYHSIIRVSSSIPA